MRTLTFLLFAMLTAAAGSAQVLDVRELNTAQIRTLDPARTAILLTGGILEEHGPYLPAYSDGYQTDFIASRLAEAIAARPGWSVLRVPDLPLGAMPANEIGGKFSFPGSYGVRSATLRAVYMDLATDLGEAGFKWIFALNYHGGPTHNQAMDDAGRYFADTFGGRMVNLTGLISVAGAVPADVFSPAERAAEGYSVHADADEHSRLLFLRPDLVAPSYRSAAPVVGKDFPALVSLAGQPDWPGYFGTPAIANATAGDRAMRALAQAAIDAALKVLDGAPDARLPRVWGVESADPEVKPAIDRSLQHEQQIESRETEWLMRR
jgi:creatinine amidohydrolase/Fe(II)-dependent formamide hydrolase-like protein